MAGQYRSGSTYVPNGAEGKIIANTPFSYTGNFMTLFADISSFTTLTYTGSFSDGDWVFVMDENGNVVPAPTGMNVSNYKYLFASGHGSTITFTVTLS